MTGYMTKNLSLIRKCRGVLETKQLENVNQSKSKLCTQRNQKTQNKEEEEELAVECSYADMPN